MVSFIGKQAKCACIGNSSASLYRCVDKNRISSLFTVCSNVHVTSAFLCSSGYNINYLDRQTHFLYISQRFCIFFFAWLRLCSMFFFSFIISAFAFWIAFLYSRQYIAMKTVYYIYILVCYLHIFYFVAAMLSAHHSCNLYSILAYILLPLNWCAIFAKRFKFVKTMIIIETIWEPRGCWKWPHNRFLFFRRNKTISKSNPISLSVYIFLGNQLSISHLQH